MRIRYNIKCCLGAVTLIALGSWWLTWPQSTFDRFIFSIETGGHGAALAMIAPSKCVGVYASSSGFHLADQQAGGESEFIAAHLIRSSYQLESATLIDILLSQRRYRRRALYMDGEVIDMQPSAFCFRVKWGKVYPSAVQ